MKQQKNAHATGSTRSILKKNVSRSDERAKTQVPKAFPKINARFREWIEQEGITLQAAADRLSTPTVTITVSNIKSIVGDVVTPNLFIIKRWNKLSGWTYDYILDGRRD